MKGVPAAEVTAHDFVMVRAALVQRLGGANNALVWTRIHFRCADGGQRFIDDHGVAWWRASNDQIGEEVGLTADQVFKATTAMRKLGFLESTVHRLGGNYDRTQSWRAVVISDDVESVDRRNGDRHSTIRTPSNDDQDGVDRRNVPTSQTEEEGKAKKRGARIPEDFAVSPEMVAWAQENTPAVDGRRATEMFKNHFESMSGVRAVKTDWVKAWKNWLLSDQQRAEQRGWKPEASRVDADQEWMFNR